MADKYCVYSAEVSDELIKIGRRTYESIQEAMEKYPDVDFCAMIHMATHQAATVATNAAIGKPLDRQYSYSENEGYAKPSSTEAS